ncbi:hypothetical protein ABE493_04490 [Stenotrophomonas terrae]|uniref:PepSY domain-containing protein n=1 Tax=Stenotrophomonas terrae TaxID=405446 RepID=UPI003208CED2
MHSLSRRRLLVALIAALVVAGPGVVVASAQQPQPSRGEHARGIEGGERVARAGRPANDRSLSDAVRRVQRETGGRILGAERVPYDGRDINRVKYMDDRGRVRYMDDPSPSRDHPRDQRAELPPRGDNS